MYHIFGEFFPDRPLSKFYASNIYEPVTLLHNSHAGISGPRLFLR